MAGKTSFLDFRDFQTCSGASLLVVHSLSQQGYTRYTYGTYVRYTSPLCPVFACPFRPNEFLYSLISPTLDTFRYQHLRY
jgi:hypothetical protein